ncbi:MAG: DUF1566 domain-containing protein [Deltaproteobacteria bacterium]|nr:DUF1566 domain-containing protein [Deltaproteobacteria bacterium]
MVCHYERALLRRGSCCRVPRRRPPWRLPRPQLACRRRRRRAAPRRRPALGWSPGCAAGSAGVGRPAPGGRPAPAGRRPDGRVGAVAHARLPTARRGRLLHLHDDGRDRHGHRDEPGVAAHLAGRTYDWDQAKAYCAGLVTDGGVAGWRLPTRIELVSIVDYWRDNPAIDPVAFPSTPSDFFWSSSPYVNAPPLGWGVGFADGTAWYSGPSARVRCVR